MFTVSQRATSVRRTQTHRSSIPPPLQLWTVDSISGSSLLLPRFTRVYLLARHTAACSEPHSQLVSHSHWAWPCRQPHLNSDRTAFCSSHSSFKLTSLVHAGKMTTRDSRSALELTCFGPQSRQPEQGHRTVPHFVNHPVMLGTRLNVVLSIYPFLSK